MSMNTSAELVIPKLNEYWPGQGGIFRGTHLLGGFLIEASDLLPKRYKFGNYDVKLDGYSDLDGAENTRKLIEIGSPSAKAAAGYSADGHGDFFLPSQRDLMQCFLATGRRNIQPWVGSSTPSGSNTAWALGFEIGGVDDWDRSNEFAVLPVRRFIP